MVDSMVVAFLWKLVGLVSGSVAGASWLTWCADGEVVVSGLMMGRLVQ